MPKDVAADYYRRHHEGETGMRRYGFTVAADERGSWMRARIGTGKSILDLGCRDGTLASHFAQGNRLTGVDIDAAALDQARARYGFDTRVVNLNVERLPFPDEQFDVVVAGEVLEHLQFPDEVVGEVRRVLRPGGLFVGSVPNSFRLKNRVKFLLGRDYELDPTHLHQFSPQGMLRLLKDFKRVELAFQGSRRLWIWPRMMANLMAFSGRR